MNKRKIEEARIRSLVANLRKEKNSKNEELFTSWLKSQQYWKEFLVSRIKPGDKESSLSLIKKYESDLKLWMFFQEETNSIYFSIINISLDSGARFLIKTPCFDLDDLCRVNEIGKIETLAGKDYKMAKLSYLIRKLERTSRKLRKQKKELEN
jgi:hypothetical protein